ncbi:MAG: PocR ligand-binding domain-containing protein [Lachnospiraceae bacterium]|nr:PocR ligand-binding domain-containing protein [Lachnospiraceae bacterium]
MELSLSELIDIDILQEIQNSFSNLFGVAANTTDKDGVPVTKGSNFSDFCYQHVRNTVLGKKRCEECDVKGALMAREAGESVVYTCHAGMLDFAAPIMLDDKVIGAFVGGQVRTAQTDEGQIRKTAKELGIDPDELAEAYKKTATVDTETVAKAAEFMSRIAGLISRSANQNYMRMEESRKKKSALFQSDYFKRINEYMKQQFANILEEAESFDSHGDVDAVTEVLDKVIKKSSDVLSVVDHMVEYMSLTGGDMNLHEASYNIREVLRPMQDMAYGMQGYDLTFDLIIDDSVPDCLFGDSMRISYIISRLMDNRFMHTPSGWIVLKISTESFSYSTMLVAEISDTGDRLNEERTSLISHYAQTGDVFTMNSNDDENSGVEVIGLLLYQVSGNISFDVSDPGTNVIRVEIPQLTVTEGS